jgi:HK97 family phage portal protein
MIISGGVITKSPSVVWSGSPGTWGDWPASLQIGYQWVSYAAMYRKQHWVRTCVDKRAALLARLPLKVYRHDDLNRPEAATDPYAQLLARPNQRHSRFYFWQWAQSTFDIYGEAFIGKIRDAGGRPYQLALLHPVAMHEVEEDDGRVTWDFDNGKVRFTGIRSEDLVHFRTYNPDSFTRGLSKLESLRATLENEDAALRAQSSFWKRGARPGVALTHPGTLSQPAADRLKFRWDQIAAGADNTGTTVVLEEGMKPEVLTLNAEEAQYIEARKLNREEVVAGYDMPPPAVHILDHATYCLPADALVTTERGPVPIVDVRVGDRVWSLVDGRLVTKQVVGSAQTGFKPLLTIRTQNRTLRCTDNHPLLVRRTVRAPKPAKSGATFLHSLEWAEAGSLKVGDVVVTANELPEHGGDQSPTRVVSEGFAEFCGLLLGDGWVNPIGSVAVARASHATYMDHYRQIMVEEFRQRDGAITLQEQDRMTRFSSMMTVRELTALGLSGNAHTKSVPAWVFGLSNKLRGAFLRGFLDADGSVDKKGRISFASCNAPMLRQIRELCIGIGVPVTNTRCQTGTVILPNGRKVWSELWTFTCSDPGANRVIGSNDSRYVERLEAGTPFGAGKLSGYYQYAPHGAVRLPPPTGCGYAKVVRIDAGDLAVPVYDLEVEGAHNFITEGVVVHNSNITEQMRSVYRDTMAPVTVFLEAELEAQLRAPDFSDDVYAEFLLDGVLRGDFEQRADAYQKSINSGWQTPAEVRKLENLPFIEGSDRLYINSTMVPLEVQAETAGLDPALIDAVGTLIRSGFDPAAILAALGLPPMGHLGLLPVTLQKEEQFDADLAAALDEPAMRMVMGRLSRQKTLDEVDLLTLVEGLNGAAVPVTRAYVAAKAAGDDIAGLRARVLALALPRPELKAVDQAPPRRRLKLCRDEAGMLVGLEEEEAR